MLTKSVCVLAVIAAFTFTARAEPADPTLGAPEPACPATTLEAHENSPTGRYTITINPWDKRVVSIDARVRTLEDGLLMYPEGAHHVPEGWATYIRNLKASDRYGNPVVLESTGAGAWRVPDRLTGQEIRLNYEILLHHDAGEYWPFGWDEAAYVKGDAIFFTGKALFITALDMQDVRVDFEIPAEWKLITPWVPGCESRSYLVANAIELTESAHFTGNFISRKVTVAGATVEIGLGNALEESAQIFEDVLEGSLRTATDMLGPVPDQTFVVIADLEPKFSGGGMFFRSVSMLFQEPPGLENMNEWGYIVSHELLHLWLGGAIKPAEDQEYWLTEGFTDYLSNLVDLRSGFITEERFWERVREHHTKYVRQVWQVSLRDAGLDKGAYYDLVYSGGFLAALVLDVEMRQRSGLANGLPDLVRALNQEFGGRAGFGPDDVVRLANQLTEGDFSPFVQDYVVGVRRLPVERALGAMGITVDRKATEDTVSSPGATRLRNRLLYGSTEK